MCGMQTMWEQNREQFEDVGMMINIEARGPWGPALLFETSNGNEKIMELYDNVAMIATVALLAVIVSVIYLWRRRAAAQQCTNSIRESAKSVAINLYTTNKLYGALLLLCLLSLILLIALGENLMFFIPLTAATAALLLYRATRLKVWLLAAIAITLLHAFSFPYALAMALTIGALGAITMLAVCDILVLLPLADLYCSKRV